MRSVFVSLASLLLTVSAARGLERTERAWDDLERSTAWRYECTATISYYNFCTGWIWVWTELEPSAVLGVHYSRSWHELPYCDWIQNGFLYSTWLYTNPGAPTGYGFTGTAEVRAATADGCLVGPPGASQPFLPVAGWQLQTWDVDVPLEFAVTYTLGATPGNPVGFVTDHPDAGPTGPPALGTCYPADRENHSFRYGTVSAPRCPGEPFLDALGAAQLLHDTEGSVHEWYPPVSVEATTWGRVKGMYR